MHSSSEDEKTQSESKKKPTYGRMREVMSKLRLQSHEIGPQCSCKQQCFKQVGDKKYDIILRMNKMASNDDINSYLSGLITIMPIQRRRPRKNQLEASHRDATFSYRVRYIVDSKPVEINVCKAAFMSLHGIGRGKVDFILKSLKLSGDPPKDHRGKHKNRKHAIPEEMKIQIYNHINSLKGRESHYSLKDSRKIYLPAELNIKKLFAMFKEKTPAVKDSLYETYRQIFNNKFNISFGYPRSDTCSQCDEYKIKKKNIESQLKTASTEAQKSALDLECKDIDSDKTIHLLRANKWYKLKRQSKIRSRTDQLKESIVYDYAKNHSVPEITTNDVYYKRQLSVFIFNVHVLSTGQSVFYVYPEITAKKGSDEVCSFLHHFFYNFLDPQVKELEVFSDSCAGQNKNNYIFKFYHHLVHKENRFSKVTGFFPIKGHSYNECDKNCALIKKSNEVEMPEDWAESIRVSRNKPFPFDVVEVEQTMVKDWTSHLNTIYRKKLGCATRPIKMFLFHKNEPAYMLYNTMYSGPWRKNPMIGNKKKGTQPSDDIEEGQFILPAIAYEGKNV